jgi:hypothetical protein
VRRQLAMKNLPANGSQTLFRYDTPKEEEREAYQVATLKHTYALHFAVLLDCPHMVEALWPKMLEYVGPSRISIQKLISKNVRF